MSDPQILIAVVAGAIRFAASVFLALSALILIRSRRETVDRKILFVVFLSTFLAFSMELLSLFSRFELSAIRVAIAVSAALAYLTTRGFLHVMTSERVPLQKHSIGSTGQLAFARTDESAARLERFRDVLLSMVLFGTVIIALWSVPNNWDSLTYHLPRIEHWLQDRSLGDYPTSNIRQLDSNPFAEELILIFRSVIADYRLANMVQWISFVGCILIAGEICKLVGGSERAKALTHILAASTPIAILEASSTQNDLVAAFFCMICVYFTLQIDIGQRYGYALPAILAGALAYLTKGTAAIFLCGFVCIYGIRMVLRKPPIMFWTSAAVGVFLAAAIVSGHLSRNWKEFGSPVGPMSAATITSHRDWRSTTLNGIRDLGTNFYLPSSAASWFRTKLNISEAEDNSDYTFDSKQIHFCSPLDEDYGYSTLQTILFIAAAGAGLIFIFRERKYNRLGSEYYAIYLLACALSAATFFFLLRWQPWIVRLELGGFMIFCPLAALLLSKIAPEKILILLAGILFIQSFVFVAFNYARPMFGQHSVFTASPNKVLFVHSPQLEPDFERFADLAVAAHARRIGLVIGGDSFEFPFWYLLRQKLRSTAMPEIVDEVETSKADPAADFVVFLDQAVARPLIGRLSPVGGFTALLVYQRSPVSPANQ